MDEKSKKLVRVSYECLDLAIKEGIVILKVILRIVTEDILKHFNSEKIMLNISYELSARQRIHMKCQALLSLKNKKIF